ncbi:hypothetical protein OC846_005368 [Tilletia horrida]|uniref:Ubiquitin 3 binding protein But2 C-terminal domain-containing protein n=1 Tax=Tilletia horrida TaxID=155126 RepID=A0AAN6GNG3_9BASI|nr:hypothetical protein OC846_005368 [Tilletia horrida]KAK0561963.1 hypothetical protein OC861_005561 [Tilletia horrida]
MISSLILNVLLKGVAFASCFAQGLSLGARQDSVLSCEDPIHIANLVLVRQDPSNLHQRAAFTSSVDTQGRLQLSTIAGDTPTPYYPQFHFRICNSTVMPTAPVEVGQGGLRSFGLLSPNYHPNKCVTLAGPILSNVSSPFVSADCQTMDAVNLASQWWAIDAPSGDVTANVLPVSFFGKPLNATAEGVYSIDSVITGNDTLVQATFLNSTSVYGLQLQIIFESA